ncbi:hypothetical protein [Brachyspira pilosicoli]|uniref:Uncharacterized protein n=1 Tax=Brachyspira pilosicoli TaxID=52584 RepID=A0A5C8F0U2_BRAPL|nr:hypothetical protein [Brachyspira pilosicoli]TXJ42100.1 hypothetical protein EPJ72_05895 [Brachyspira pilosicoli]
MKENIKKLISLIPLFIIIILFLWYKTPINGINCYPQSVKKITVEYQNKLLNITNTNDIEFIIKSLNSISLNKIIPIMKKNINGYKINMVSTNKKIPNDIIIYSKDTASIGHFYYTDKNTILPYDYIKNIFSNK